MKMFLIIHFTGYGERRKPLSTAADRWRAGLPIEEMTMTKGYWIVRVSVRDETRYPDYLAAARPAFEKFGAKFLVRGGPFEAMEGHARERNVVVEFRDRAAALACYQSAEYQAARALRQKYADSDFAIVEGAA
jgi:uncharacterized protein (DUF1330 family)